VKRLVVLLAGLLSARPEALGQWSRHQGRLLGVDVPPGWKATSGAGLAQFQKAYEQQSAAYYKDFHGGAEGGNSGLADLAVYQDGKGATMAAVVLRVPPQEPGYLDELLARSKAVMDYGQKVGRIRKTLKIVKTANLSLPGVHTDAESASDRELVYSFFSPANPAQVVQLVLQCPAGRFGEYGPVFDRIARSFTAAAGGGPAQAEPSVAAAIPVEASPEAVEFAGSWREGGKRVVFYTFSRNRLNSLLEITSESEVGVWPVSLNAALFQFLHHAGISVSQFLVLGNPGLVAEEKRLKLFAVLENSRWDAELRRQAGAVPIEWKTAVPGAALATSASQASPAPKEAAPERTPTAPAPSPEAEQNELREALADAGNSQPDFIRAIERHLARYPQTTQRAELERAVVRAAIELRDSRRVVRYGEAVLAREPQSVDILERVSRYLLDTEDREQAKRSLEYAQRLENILVTVIKPERGMRGAARMAEELRIRLGKALVYQARATGTLGRPDAAEALARRSFQQFPSAESAREIARWLDKQGKTEQALPFFAEAFMIPDPNSDEASRRKDRARLGEAYRKVKGSEAGIGDLLMAAFDRTSAAIAAYRDDLRRFDPNVDVTDPMEFTLSGLNGDTLKMSSLKGKVVVLDFWATWCGPCRAQQPLYEKVMARFKQNRDVVFLNINTDEDRSVVKPFLDREKWSKTVYFEDGLSALLRINSIPLTIVVNPRGEIASRLNFIPERFVDMLTARITDAAAEK